MNIKQTIITATVALTAVALIAPVSAGAVTIADLQAQISALMAQLQALQGGQTTTTGTIPAACVGVTFSRNLTVGSTGSDVKCLQAILNANGYTVATTGAGSPGHESTYFGSKTLAAVQKWQDAKFGYHAKQIGPSSRSTLNAWLAGGTTTGGTTGTTGGTTGTTVTPTGAGLAVMLASDNPAAGTVVAGQGVADLGHFTFVNGDNAAVSVTTLNLNRIGISNDTTLANVYLYNGAQRLTDGASVSSGVINFNNPSGLFSVPAGGSVTIRVLADIASGSSGQTMGVSVNSSTSVTSNASSVHGAFPVSGNLFTSASGTLAGVDFSATTTPSTSTVNPQNNYVVWENVTTINTRAVKLSRFALLQTGSIGATDVQNYRLFIDGVQVGAAVPGPDVNGYITFDLSSAPVTLQTGARTIEVQADIIAGSSKTFIYSLRETADAAFADSQFGVAVIPTDNNGSTFSQRITGTETIASGTLTFTKSTTSPSGNVVLAAPNVPLADFTLTAAGEPVKVTDMYVGITDSTAGVSNVRNVALYANGVQIGSTTNVTAQDTVTGTHFGLGSSLIVNPGSPVTLEIRSDIHENSGTAIASNDVLQAVIIAGSSNATGQVSKNTISTPSANVSGNSVTVQKGTLTLSKYTAYTNQSVVPPLQKTKIADFTLSADTTEGININTLEVALNNVISSYATNLYVVAGSNTTSIMPTVQATNTWSVNYSLPAGQSMDISVYADINANAGGTGNVGLYVAGTTASSAQSVSAGTAGSTSSVQGQNIVFTTGSFTPAVDGSTPNPAIVSGGHQVVAGAFKFSSVYDSYTIQELRFTVNANSNQANNSAALSDAVLMNGSTPLATATYDSADNYFRFTGLNLLVPVNTTQILTLSYDVSPSVSSTTSTSQVDVQPTLSYEKYMNSSGTVTTSSSTYATGNSVYVFKSIPTITKSSSVGNSVTGVTNGTTTNVYAWTVGADAKGPVTVKQLKLKLNWSVYSGHVPYLYAFTLYKDGVNVSSQVSISDDAGHNLQTQTAASGASSSSNYIIVTWTTEDTIAAGSTHTYVLQATAGNNGTSGWTSVASVVGADSVAINMPSDASVNGATVKYINQTNATASGPVVLVTSAGGTPTSENLIWSDDSAVSHSSTTAANGSASTSSGDWANGYLVQSLPLSTTTIVGP